MTEQETILLKESDEGKIYNTDAITLLQMLPGMADLHIIDIPYDISEGKQNIKLAGRADMVRNFGSGDKIKFSFEDLAEVLDYSAKKDSNLIIFFNNWERYSDLFRCIKPYYDDVYCLVWEKSNPRPQIRKRHFVMSHELIIWAYRGNYTFNFSEHSQMKTFVNGSVPRRWRYLTGDIVHTNQKPTWIYEHFIKILTNEGDTVIDAFCGSGVCAVASRALQRKYIISDIGKPYLDFLMENKL